jgi:hypothetical protein
MADFSDLEQALINADKAGDSHSASLLAAEIQKRRAAASAPEQAKSAFDAMPWYMKPLQAADDTVRNLANNLTLGYADKIAAALGGTDVAAERAKSDDARARAGSAAIGTDILGLMVPGGVASDAIKAGVPMLRGATMLPTMAREGLAGMGIGAGMASGNDTDMGEGVGLGAIGGVLGPVAARGVGSVVNKVASKVGLAPGILSEVQTAPRMTVPEQTAAKNAAYQAVDDAGINYSPADVRDMLTKMKTGLKDADMDRELHRPAAIRMKRLQSRIGTRTRKPTSLNEMDTQRQLINRDVRGDNGVDAMGGIMRGNIDDMIANVNPANATSADAQGLIGNAREANRQLMVRQAAEAAKERGIDAGTMAGERSAFRAMKNKDGGRGQSPEEKRLLNNIVRGGSVEEGLSRWMGGLNLGSFGTGATAGGILSGGNPFVAGATGLAAMGVPRVARAAAAKYQSNNIEALLDHLGGAKKQSPFLQDTLRKLGGGQAGGALTIEGIDRERRRKRRRGEPY